MLTVLFTDPDRRACKQWIGDECRAYDAGTWFTHRTLAVGNFGELAATLEAITKCPQALIIRGAVRPGAPERIMRRYLARAGYEPQIEPMAQPWAILDFDKTSIAWDPADPSPALEALRETLPEGLRNCSFWWHLSGSAHASTTVRAHLAFFLDRAYSDRELKAALRRVPGLDLSLFSPVQPHFVANPLFDGEDPLPVRSGISRGVTDIGTIAAPGGERLRTLAEEMLAKAVREIRKACKAGESRHPVINREAYTVGQLCPHLIDPGTAFRALFAAATSPGGLSAERAQDEIKRALEDGAEKPELIGEDWRGELSYGKDYSVRPTLANVTKILANDPRWDSVLSYNARKRNEWFEREPPFADHACARPAPREADDHDGGRLAIWLSEEYRCTVPTTICDESLRIVANQRFTDPVADYLDSLEWDGEPRVATVPGALFGDTSGYAAEAFSAWLLSAVQRVYEPGCQADHVVVLEGAQGTRKTTFLRWLAGDWYAELGGDLAGKDSVLAVQAGWIVDMNELAAIRKTDLETFKGFATRTTDKVRLPYGRREVELPRRSVIAATHNPIDGEGYLRDPTGHRRLWPIQVTRQITGLTPDFRDQLWAEARALYFAGETTWELSPDALAELDRRHYQRLETPDRDAWVDLIEAWLRHPRDSITVANVLQGAINLDRGQMDRRAQVRAAQALRVLGLTPTPGHREWVLPTDWHVAPSVLAPVTRLG